MHNLKDTDRYGDEDVPEVDYKPYENNHFEPHPQAGGENSAGQTDRMKSSKAVRKGGNKPSSTGR